MSPKVYGESELEASIRRAFTEGERADYIQFDGHSSRSPFLVQSLDLGLRKGWLHEDEATGRFLSEEQWTVRAYRLTPAGKKYFGVK